MNLPKDERLLMVQFSLTQERKVVMARKRQLFEQFKAFALNQLKTYGEPFKVTFRSINGQPTTKYVDLEMNDDFYLVYGSFSFDPKTNLITNYVRNEFRSKKTQEDISKLADGQLIPVREEQKPLESATELEKSRIDKAMNEKVENILNGIFDGKLGFNDPAFKTLVEMTISTEQELQQLDTRIAALDIVNNGTMFEPENKIAEKQSSGPVK